MLSQGQLTAAAESVKRGHNLMIVSPVVLVLAMLAGDPRGAGFAEGGGGGKRAGERGGLLTTKAASMRCREAGGVFPGGGQGRGQERGGDCLPQRRPQRLQKLSFHNQAR